MALGDTVIRTVKNARPILRTLRMKLRPNEVILLGSIVFVRGVIIKLACVVAYWSADDIVSMIIL